ncbi:MAG: tryptophan synthase subunit alpha [Pseudomonadota bacterium]
MSRLSKKLNELSRVGRKALIPFITAGDPKPAFTVSTLHALVDAGADIIELGVPFSDPMADGPVIQRASERALVHKTSLRDVLGMVKAFRVDDSETPVVLMGYLNPVECMGYTSFAEAAAEAGVDGVLTVDMPPEEASELVELLTEKQVDAIFLLAPNSTDKRIRMMGEVGRGYLYYVSLKGVTGASHLDLGDVERKLAQIRRNTDLPIGVGFGVKDAQTAAAVARLADAVVVGSALISRIEANLNRSDEEIRAELVGFLKTMRAAMDA